MPGFVTTWMGDCLQTGKPSHVASHLDQLSLPSLLGRKSSTGLSGWG